MSQTSINTRKTKLEAALSKVCGFQVEITVRGETSFTLSAEGCRSFQTAIDFLNQTGRVSDVSHVWDEECEMTFCYFGLS